MQSRPPTPEVALVLAACRWPVDSAAVRSAAAAPIDWDKFAALARRHRVEGLVNHALRSADIGVPVAFGESIAAAARSVATESLRLAAESLRLIEALRAADIAVLVIKGTPLAMLAYRTLALKAAWDIDLLIPPDRLADAIAVLETAGYACVTPGPEHRAIAAWHLYSKDSVWRDARGMHVELHTALVEQPALLPTLNAQSNPQFVTIAPALELPTLDRDSLFAYLCVHGAVSGWWRLKWLADVNALISTMPSDELAPLLDRAERMGAGRAPGEALLLCQRNLGREFDPLLARRLAARRGTRRMVRIAEYIFLAADKYDDPSKTIVATAPVHLHGALVQPGWRSIFRELRRKLRRPPKDSGMTSPLGRRLRSIGAALSPTASR